MSLITVNISIPGTKHLRRRVVRYFRRQYIWLDSSQRIIHERRNWRETSALRMHTHRLIAALAGTIIDTEYIEWKEIITENNARLFRQSSRTPRWERYSQANMEDCIVNPCYNQFLELMMDEDIAKYFAENKPIGDTAIKKGLEKSTRDYDEYKREYNMHIKFIDNKERYESVLWWGYMSNRRPFIIARVYEEKTLPFPEDFHFASGRSFDFSHIYRFINKEFPKEA